MSAYVVDKSHIDAILTGIFYGRTYAKSMTFISIQQQCDVLVCKKTADEIGQMLVDECVESVAYRYPDDSLEELPGPVDAHWMQKYHYKRTSRIPEPREVLALIRTYAYQSCEHPAWRCSDAEQFCVWAAYHFVSELPQVQSASGIWKE